MKKFSFISGFLALFVSLFLIISLKCRIPLFLTLIIPAALFVYTFSGNKNSLWGKKLSITANLLSVAAISAFLISGIFMAINLPMGETFTKKLPQTSIKPELEETYNRINFRIKQLSIILSDSRKASEDFDTLLDKYDYTSGAVSKTLNESLNARNELIKLYTQSAFSIPENLYTDRYVENGSENEAFYGQRLSKEYQYENHVSFFKLELTEINWMLKTGLYEKGLAKYKNLWKSQDILLSSNNISMDNILIFESIAKLLIDFYSTNLNVFKKLDMAGIMSLSQSIESKLGQSIQLALSKEYEIAAHNLSKVRYKWPFLDYNKTTKLYHDMFVSIMENINTMNSSNNIPISIDSLNFKNPVGSSYYQKGLKAFDKVDDNLIQVKKLLSKFNKDI